MQNSSLLAAKRPLRVLAVEDDLLLGQTYQSFLENSGFVVSLVASLAGARLALQAELPDVLLLDLLLPDGHGLDLLAQMHRQQWQFAVVVVTTVSSVESAVNAIQAGASDYLVKPVDENRLVTTVRNACERQELHRKLDHYLHLPLREQFQGFMGRSAVMQVVYRIIEGAAASQASVFITGESGTGKELCAEAIHNLGARKSGPFFSINCAAIPRELLESELFGHAKGAFTGATDRRRGAAALAHGGTLFFDEVCDLDPDLQAKLLRFIQSKRFRPVGSDTEVSTDVRFICATNRDPLADVRAGRFREDLYYRLHVIPVELPALRERDDDILLLARHFLHRYADEEGKRFEGFSPEAEQGLLAYAWPGNVRELQNLLHKVVVMGQGGIIEAAMLGLPPPRGGPPSRTGIADARAEPETIRPLWLEEKDTIERAIRLCGGNVVEAARQLGISDSTVYRKRSRWQEMEK